MNVEEGPFCSSHGGSKSRRRLRLSTEVVLLFKLRVVRLGGVIT
jgi:hypothetical protein